MLPVLTYITIMIRPGPSAKSTDIQPRPTPPAWTRWKEVEEEGHNMELDNHWEDIEISEVLQYQILPAIPW